jgi:hypothetical protein
MQHPPLRHAGVDQEPAIDSIGRPQANLDARAPLTRPSSSSVRYKNLEISMYM